MAGITYDIVANTSGAVNPIKQLQTQVQKTTESFGGLRTAIAAIGVGAAIRNAVGFADAIQDIADASGLAIANITGFSRAVALNGGNAEAAQAAILRLSQSVGQAAQGSLAAQDAFAQVGITLRDLATLSEQELFDKTIQGLAGIEDTARRTVLQNELLGKSLRGVNLQTVASQYGAATAASVKYARSIQQAAELQNKLDIAFGQLSLSVLRAIEPLADFINKLQPEQIERFIEAVVKIGGAAVAITAAVKAFEGLVKVLGLLGGVFALYRSGLASVAGGVATVATGATGLAKTFNWLKSSIGGILSGVIPLSRAMTVLGQRFSFLIGTRAGLGALALGFGGIVAGAGKVALAIAAVGAAVVGVNELIKLAFDIDPIDSMARKLEELVTKYFPGLAAAINRAGQALGMAAPPSAPGQPAGVSAEEQKRLAAAAQARAEQERQVVDALAKQRSEIAGLIDDYRQVLDTRAEQLEQEISLVGAGEGQRDLQQALTDLRGQERAEIEKLTKAQSALSEEQKRAGFAAEYQRQIDQVRALSAAEQERLTRLVSRLNEARAAEALRQFGLRQEFDAQDRLRGIERERATLTLSNIQKKYQEIVWAAEDSATAAIREENARRGIAMSAQEEARYRATAIAGVNKLIQAQQRLYTQSREFSTGWNRAFEDFVEAAGDAASQAQRLFQNFTRGIEDLIVNFAKTGKFEWRQFVASMLEELLRANIQQVMAQTLQLPNPFSATGGSINDLLGGLFGGLAGGNQQRGNNPGTPLYVIDVAGGGGGGGLMPQVSGQNLPSLGKIGSSISSGLGSVISGISSTVGKVVSGVSSIGSGLFNTIKSVGSSIGDFFGGFFANGGTLPAGKFGVVGERGPELIRGPADITPMSGMNTSVTYNINAVDARSFQQLLAQDPTFIFALTEQGRKSYAGAR